MVRGNAGDWVGLFAVGGDARLAYYYLSGTGSPPATGLTSATFPTYAPLNAGDYEWRLFLNNSWTRIATSGVITVTPSPATLRFNGAAAPGPAAVAAGAQVSLSVADGPGNAGDWVGLFPVDGETRLAYYYLNGTGSRPATGVTGATFPTYAPSTAGEYEWRLYLNDSWSRIATSGVLTVTSPATLGVNGVAAPSPVTVVAGTQVSLSISDGPGNPRDWVGLFPVGSDARLAYYYLNGTGSAPATGVTSATFPTYAPLTAGQYEWRLFANDSWSRIATSGLITVSPSPATLRFNGAAAPGPATVAAGAQVSLSVADGPGNAADWVGLFPVGGETRLAYYYLNGTGSKPATGVTGATFPTYAPSTAGEYEWRLYLNDSWSRIATSGVLTVTSPATLGVNGVAAPGPVTVVAGTQVSLSISDGPGNPKDWVGLFPVGSDARLAYYYLNGTGSAPAAGVTSATFPTYAPLTAGQYEWRLFANDSWSRVATSGVITVSTSPAMISVNGVTTPVTVAPGGAITAQLVDGPGNPTDWIAFAAHSASNYERIDWRYLNGSGTPPTVGLTSATLSFTAPTAPGTYELRLFPNNGVERLVTSALITVDASLTTPTLSIPSGTYTSEQAVTVNSPDTGVALHYTLTGVDPVETDATVAPGATLTITQSQELKVRAFRGGSTPSAVAAATYTLQVATPVATPAAGAYTTPQAVAVTTTTPGAMLRYTTDGTEPTETSSVYSAAISVAQTTTLRVAGFRPGWSPSPLLAATYTMNYAAARPTLAGGAAFTLVAKDDGTVWAFGLNNNGQLGDNTTTIRATPQQVAGLSSITAVAAGSLHAMALTTGGTLYLWGDNLYGQLGDGSVTDRRTPVLASLSDVIAIAAGEFHSLALTSNGDVYAWGRNNFGQIGNGNTTAVTAPTLVETGAVAIGAGRNHSLAVKSDGTSWAWGANGSGQLGNNTTSTGATTAPVQLLGITTASKIAGGEAHSFIILGDGTLKGAGENGAGQLADTTSTDRWMAITIGSLSNVSHVASGLDHVFALLGDGTVYGWGENSAGELGLGTSADVRSPVALTGLSGVTAMAAGWSHSIALDAYGVVSTWGANASSQLGDGTTTARSTPVAVSQSGYAWRVATPVFSVASGTYNVDRTVVVTVDTAGATIHYTQNGVEPTETDPALTSGGGVLVTSSQTLKAKAWRDGMPAGETKQAVYTLKVATPTVSPTATTYTTPQNVTMSTTTPGTTLRYTVDGTNPTESSTAFTGPVNTASTTTYRIIGFKSGWTASDLRVSTYTMNFGTLATPTVDPATGAYTGTVSVTMASPQDGATIRHTTNNTAPSATSPIYSEPLSLSTTTTVRARVFHPNYTASAETSRTYTVTTDAPTLDTAPGSYAPGSTVTITAGQPADTLRMTIDGTDPISTSPVIASGTTMALGNFTLKVKASRPGATDSAIANAAYSLTGPLGPGSAAAGGTHSVIATPDGRVIAWGENGNGQIGNESTVDRTTPTTLNTITGVTQVAGGLAHTLARTWNGQVFAWGSNTSGRLGDGTTTQRTRPVPVTTLTDVVAVAAGDAHSLALTADGRVLAWGANASGELGLGHTTATSTPTLIATLSDIVAIAAGDTHSLAVTGSGQLYAWGANGSSRLGDGTTTNRTSPVLVNLPDVVAVGAGAAHSLALTSSGAVYSWGLNTNGQLGLGNTTLRSTPTLISPLHASAIAAGDNFSVALGGDGILVGWGLNSAGQLGDMTITQRTSPVVVAVPASVASLGLGDTHALAVTPEGDVWTWGAGASGQLGDGGVANRATPQAVLTGLAFWAPAAPTLSLPSGTWTTAQVVTVTSPVAGAVLRYTLDGAAPTETSAEVPAGGDVAIDYSVMFRARAFIAGRLPGAIARASYELQTAAPSISPDSGTYPTAQVVTLSVSGPPSEIRYTLDGSTPTASSLLYVDPVVVATGLTLKARGFALNGWSPSPTSSATYAFNYGVLDPPVASPDGGIYGSAQQVTLTALAGATIRYTTNGADPTASSAIYGTPILIASGTRTVKARAFHPDWTDSAVDAQTYIIDITPPTIIAKRFPLPMGNWQRTPVTVSFVCADNAGVATCSSPATVSLEGAGQTVAGTAVDHVGLEATVQETVNVDLTPPVVTLTEPVEGLVTASASVTVTAEVDDALSGLGIVNCNGIATPVVDGVVTCTTALRPGRNAITVSARDVAGHSSSSGVMVTRAGTATRLTLSPAGRTMLVNETATLSLRDDFGVPAPGASWVSNDPAVVSLSPDDPPVLTALAAGVATVTATRNGLSSTSTITVVVGTVLADGSTGLADGTTRWTVAPSPGPNLSWFEGPIYTHRIDESGPDMFMVETNTTTWERTLRAVSASGEVDWLAASPGVPLMGDMYGGVVAGVEPSPNYCVGPFNEIQRCYTALTRFPGAGTGSWRYDSPGLVDRPAQGPDGTIYVVEHTGDYLYAPNNTGNAYFPYPGEKALVILDGATGDVTARVPLEGDAGYEPVTVGPIVSGDGFGYVLVTKGREITLRRLSRDGQAESTVIVPATCTGSQCRAPVPGQLLPDGLGGLLITADWANASYLTVDLRVTRFDGEGERTDTALASNAGTIELIGQGGTAYLRQTSGATTVSQPVMDVLTWTPRWSLPIEWTLLAARPDGGALAENAAGDLGWFDGTGQLLESGQPLESGQLFASGLLGSGQLLEPAQLQVTTPSLGLHNPVQEFGGWLGNSDYGLRAVAGTIDDATYWNATKRTILWSGQEQYGFGNQRRQNAPPPSYTTREEAALKAMDFLYPLSAAINAEYGGLICQQNNRFVWSRFVTDRSQNSVYVPDNLCPSGAMAARLHTHPPMESPFPSGGDVANANLHQGIPNYIKAPRPNGLPVDTWFLKFWNDGSRTADQNYCVNTGASGWQPYIASANCMTPWP